MLESLELYRKTFATDLLLGRVSDFSAELLNPFPCGGGGNGEGGGRRLPGAWL
jgi:hypothetical protein